MQVVLVGQQNGRRRVRWLAAIGFTVLLTFVFAAVGNLTYFLLAGEWSVLAALIPATGALVVVGVGLVIALQTPVEKLTPMT